MEENIILPQEETTAEVVDIQFRPGQKIYFFDPAGLKLKAGDNVTGTFEVTYLGDYTSTSTTNDLGWGANGLDIQTRQVGAVELRVTGGNSTYKLSTFEEEAVYQLTYYEDGNKIGGDALKRVDEPTVQISGGNAQYELEKKFKRII